MPRISLKRVFSLVLALAIFCSALPAAAASGPGSSGASAAGVAPAAQGKEGLAIFFAADGLRPDIVRDYAAQG
jgi:hypothetical protein